MVSGFCRDTPINFHWRLFGREKQKARIAEKTQIQRAGLQRFCQRCGGLEMLPVDSVRRVFQDAGSLHRSANVVVVLITDMQEQWLSPVGKRRGEQGGGERGT
jgi:hypothetical protein